MSNYCWSRLSVKAKPKPPFTRNVAHTGPTCSLSFHFLRFISCHSCSFSLTLTIPGPPPESIPVSHIPTGKGIPCSPIKAREESGDHDMPQSPLGKHVKLLSDFSADSGQRGRPWSPRIYDWWLLARVLPCLFKCSFDEYFYVSF